jgi:poly(A) polymerase
VSRAQISANALKVLYRLKSHGYQSYLVGGCVRDLLLGLEPKDFDVVTDASPEQVKAVFRNCRLIGRRFRLAHVHYGREIIEVATFRGSAHDESGVERVHENGRLLRDNVYGTIEEDVWRRDFTVNALYYNIRDFSIIDYVDGYSDHQQGVLRLIGDAAVRYREDPVRMLRAVRFSAKLDFQLDSDSAGAIGEMAGLLQDVPSARLYDEILKLFLSGAAVTVFESLENYRLFAVLFPDTDKCLRQAKGDYPRALLLQALANTDSRIAEGKPVTPYFLLAAFLWATVQNLVAIKVQNGMNVFLAIQEAGNEVIAHQVRFTAFPKRVGLSMREVWGLQPRFEQRGGARAFRVLAHPRFRAAYDFLLLRAGTGDADPELAQWWTDFQEVDNERKKEMVRLVQDVKKRGRRRKKPTVRDKGVVTS